MKSVGLVLILGLALVAIAENSRQRLIDIPTPYRYGTTEDSRGLRSEVWKWDLHFASEIQKTDRAISMALTPGMDMHANTSHEALFYFTHRVHCLALCVTNQAQAIEFTNIVERWITNMPTGPE